MLLFNFCFILFVYFIEFVINKSFIERTFFFWRGGGGGGGQFDIFYYIVCTALAQFVFHKWNYNNGYVSTHYRNLIHVC